MSLNRPVGLGEFFLISWQQTLKGLSHKEKRVYSCSILWASRAGKLSKYSNSPLSWIFSRLDRWSGLISYSVWQPFQRTHDFKPLGAAHLGDITLCIFCLISTSVFISSAPHSPAFSWSSRMQPNPNSQSPPTFLERWCNTCWYPLFDTLRTTHRRLVHAQQTTATPSREQCWQTRI